MFNQSSKWTSKSLTTYKAWVKIRYRLSQCINIYVIVQFFLTQMPLHSVCLSIYIIMLRSQLWKNILWWYAWRFSNVLLTKTESVSTLGIIKQSPFTSVPQGHVSTVYFAAYSRKSENLTEWWFNLNDKAEFLQ